jgi:4'-phosphopantetheinyl transferase EntD
MNLRVQKFGEIEIHLVNIQGNLDLLNPAHVAPWFTSAEMQIWEAISAEKRQREYAAVRYLLCSQGLKGGLFYEDEVPKLTNGTHISISHSHDWVGVAYCDAHPIGMDLEFIQEKVARVYEKYVHEDERELFPNSDLQKATLLWSFKETVYKLMRQPGLLFSEDICVFQDAVGQFVARVSAETGIFEVPLGHQLIQQYVLTFNAGDVQKQA